MVAVPGENLHREWPNEPARHEPRLHAMPGENLDEPYGFFLHFQERRKRVRMRTQVHRLRRLKRFVQFLVEQFRSIAHQANRITAAIRRPGRTENALVGASLDMMDGLDVWIVAK
jgi:hypothetical protein